MRLGTYPSRTCENYYPVLFNFILNKKLSRFPSSAWKSPELMLLWKRPVMQIPGIKGCGRPLWRNGGSREQSSVGTGFKAIFSNSRSLTYRSSPEVRHSSQLGGAYFAGWVSPVGGGFPLFAPGFLRTGAPHGIQPCPHFLARRGFASRCLTQREFRSWSIERSEAKDIPQHHDIGLLAEQVPRNLAGECLAGFGTVWRVSHIHVVLLHAWRLIIFEKFAPIQVTCAVRKLQGRELTDMYLRSNFSMSYVLQRLQRLRIPVVANISCRLWNKHVLAHPVIMDSFPTRDEFSNNMDWAFIGSINPETKRPKNLIPQNVI